VEELKIFYFILYLGSIAKQVILTYMNPFSVVEHGMKRERERDAIKN